MASALGGAGVPAAAAPAEVAIAPGVPSGAGLVLIYEATAAAAAGASAAAPAMAPGKYILVGKESKFCTDADLTDMKAAYDAAIAAEKTVEEAEAAKAAVPPFFTKLNNPFGATVLPLPKFTQDVLTERQRFVRPPGMTTDAFFEAAKAKFTERLIAISRVNPGVRLTFDTPVLRDAGSVYTTNFRYLHDQSKYGIIKGSRERNAEKTHYVESTETTIFREFFEETGVRLVKKPEFKATISKYDIYVTKTSDQRPDPEFKSMIENKIVERARRQYGELFDMEFMRLDTALRRIEDFNGISGDAITILNYRRMLGGKRKKQTRQHQRLHRRALSHLRTKKTRRLSRRSSK